MAARGDIDRPRVAAVLLGHVDSGKSTLLGHLLYQMGGLSEREMGKLRAEAEVLGKESFQFAFVSDRLRSERVRGVTLNWHASRQLFTPEFAWSIIDTPGHRDFLKNTIRGVSAADVAILCVAASRGEFEASIDREFGMVRQHLLAAYGLGVSRLIVSVNKLDSESVGTGAAREARFVEVCEEVRTLVRRLAPPLLVDIVFVPVSAWRGFGLAQAWPEDTEDVTGWYDGPTLIDALDNCAAGLLASGQFKPDRDLGLPFRLPLRDIYKIPGVGTVAVGRVISGAASPEQLSRTSGPLCQDVWTGVPRPVDPVGARGTIKSIESHHEQRPQATCGELVGVNIKDLGYREISRGMVMSLDNDMPAVAVREFVIRGVLFGHPGQLHFGWSPIFDCGMAHVSCTFMEFIEKTPVGSTELQPKPPFIRSGDTFVARVRAQKPIVVEPYNANPTLGRVLIREWGWKIVGIARVEEIGAEEGYRAAPKMTKAARKTG
jgi:elongation factor 1-alpha